MEKDKWTKYAKATQTDSMLSCTQSKIFLLTTRRWTNGRSILVIHNSLCGDAGHIVMSCMRWIRLGWTSRCRVIIAIWGTLFISCISIWASSIRQHMGLHFRSPVLPIHSRFSFAVNDHGSGSDFGRCTLQIISHWLPFNDSFISLYVLPDEPSLALLVLQVEVVFKWPLDLMLAGVSSKRVAGCRSRRIDPDELILCHKRNFALSATSIFVVAIQQIISATSPVLFGRYIAFKTFSPTTIG